MFLVMTLKIRSLVTCDKRNSFNSYSDGGGAPKARSRSPTSNGKRAQVMFLCMYIFQGYLTIQSTCESKVVSCCSSVNCTLHRHDIIRVRFLTSARHVKIEKDCFLEENACEHVHFQENACELMQQHTFSSEDRRNGLPAIWAAAARWSGVVAPLPLLSPMAFHRSRLSGRSCSVCSAMTYHAISMSNPSFTPTTLTCSTGRSPTLKI